MSLSHPLKIGDFVIPILWVGKLPQRLHQRLVAALAEDGADERVMKTTGHRHTLDQVRGKFIGHSLVFLLFSQSLTLHQPHKGFGVFGQSPAFSYPSARSIAFAVSW